MLILFTSAAVFVGAGKGMDAFNRFWKRRRCADAKIQAVATNMSDTNIQAIRDNIGRVSVNSGRDNLRWHSKHLIRAISTGSKRPLHAGHLAVACRLGAESFLYKFPCICPSLCPKNTLKLESFLLVGQFVV